MILLVMGWFYVIVGMDRSGECYGNDNVVCNE